MNKLVRAAELWLKTGSWRDLAVLKICLLSLGMLLGLPAPGRKTRPAAWAASAVFAASYVPLMGSFLTRLLGEQADTGDLCG